MSKIDQAGYDGAFMDGVMTERNSKLQNSGDINNLIASSSINAYNSGILHGQRIQAELILEMLKAEGPVLHVDRIEAIIEACK